jgi:hypothetical protein
MSYVIDTFCACGKKLISPTSQCSCGINHANLVGIKGLSQTVACRITPGGTVTNEPPKDNKDYN